MKCPKKAVKVTHMLRFRPFLYFLGVRFLVTLKTRPGITTRAKEIRTAETKKIVIILFWIFKSSDILHDKINTERQYVDSYKA